MKQGSKMSSEARGDLAGSTTDTATNVERGGDTPTPSEIRSYARRKFGCACDMHYMQAAYLLAPLPTTKP